MDVERIHRVLISVNWSVQNGNLVELSICSDSYILLPVEDLLVDIGVIKGIVVEVTIFDWAINDILNLLVDRSHLFFLRAKSKEVLHLDCCMVHGPLHDHLDVLDGRVHKVTSEVEDNLGLKVLLSDFFNQAPEFVNGHLLASLVLEVLDFLNTTIFKDKVSIGNVEEGILLGLSRELSVSLSRGRPGRYSGTYWIYAICLLLGQGLHPLSN